MRLVALLSTKLFSAGALSGSPDLRFLLDLGFSGAVGESGDLAVRLSALRFSTVEKIGILAGAYAPNLDAEELQAFANAISGISEAFCRWSLHNPEIPRERILGYFRDFITSAIAAAQQRAAQRA